MLTAPPGFSTHNFSTFCTSATYCFFFTHFNRLILPYSCQRNHKIFQNGSKGRERGRFHITLSEVKNNRGSNFYFPPCCLITRPIIAELKCTSLGGYKVAVSRCSPSQHFSPHCKLVMRSSPQGQEVTCLIAASALQGAALEKKNQNKTSWM